MTVADVGRVAVLAVELIRLARPHERARASGKSPWPPLVSDLDATLRRVDGLRRAFALDTDNGMRWLLALTHMPPSAADALRLALNPGLAGARGRRSAPARRSRLPGG
jgi:hypothetical protein